MGIRSFDDKFIMLGGSGGLRVSGAGGDPTYLLRDDFTTNAGAPLSSPRTCEPGPGILTLTDTGNKLSVSGSGIVVASSTGVGDPGIALPSLTRAYGLLIAASLITTNAGGGYGPYFFIATRFLGFWSSTEIVYNDATNFPTIGNYSTGSAYTVSAIARSEGCVYVIKGGAYSTYTILWVSSDDSGSISASIACADASQNKFSADFIRVAQTSLASDSAIATAVIASPTSPSATTSTGNAIVEFTWTPTAGETLELDVRRTDADNRWIIRCAQAGGTIKLIERNAGVETERSSAAQTWTAGVSRRIVVIFYGTTIKSYVANIEKNSYTSASFNQTATGVNVSGFTTGENLIAWPRILSGAALAELEKYIS